MNERPTSSATNPLAGTWKVNLAKSKRHPNHLFSSLTMHFEISSAVVVVTYTGVNMGGEEESGTQKFHPDGKEHPIPQAAGLVEVSRWVGRAALETAARKDGKVVGESRYEVSSDEKVMTAKIRGIDGSGQTVEQVIVFDRE